MQELTNSIPDTSIFTIAHSELSPVIPFEQPGLFKLRHPARIGPGGQYLVAPREIPHGFIEAL